MLRSTLVIAVVVGAILGAAATFGAVRIWSDDDGGAETTVAAPTATAESAAPIDSSSFRREPKRALADGDARDDYDRGPDLLVDFGSGKTRSIQRQLTGRDGIGRGRRLGRRCGGRYGGFGSPVII